MIEVMATRDAYNTSGTSNLGLVPGNLSPADGLTKPKNRNTAPNVIMKCKDDTPASQ